MFAELAPKHRRKSLTGAFRKVGNSVKKTAKDNLRGSGLGHAGKMLSGVRLVILKRRVAGFRVTVASKKANKRGKGESGMHVNRNGQKKPVLIWSELGTGWRYTKSNGGKRGYRRRAAHRTGQMPRYGFIEKTYLQVKDKAGADLKDEIVNSVMNVAKKYGCS